MSAGSESSVNVPPSPLPNPVVFAWLAFLEGIVAYGLVVFSITLLEGGEIIPDVLAEWRVGAGVFVAVTGLMIVYRLYKDSYIGF